MRFFFSLLFSIPLLWLSLFLWFALQVPSGPPEDDTPTNVIVVLTGARGRISHGVELLRQGKGKVLFISGVGDNVKVSDLLAHSAGLPDDAVVALGRQARDTSGNALETARWMHRQDYHSMRLVTSNYHMPRSLLEFREAMPDIHILPEPFFAEDVPRQWWRSSKGIRLVISEFHKYLGRRLHYWVEE